MRIINPGRDVTQTLEAVCNNCTCQFECTEHEAERTQIHHMAVFHIKCPHCGNPTYLDKKKELSMEQIRDKFSDVNI